MSKICFVNGSPRGKNSGSSYLIERTVAFLNDKKTEAVIIYISDLLKSGEYQSAFESIAMMDRIVFAFPLYQDSPPGIMLDFLGKLEAYLLTDNENRKRDSLPQVYAIVNSGFIESRNNRHALKILAHFCRRAGLNWQYGLGIGAGEFMKKQDNLLYLWMKQPVIKALSALCNELENPSRHPQDNVFVSPGMPAFIYNFAANKEWRNRMECKK